MSSKDWIIIMDCKGAKQKLQCCPINEDPQNDGEKESKRPRTDDNGDEVQQFFTLVDRIQTMQRLFKQKRMNFISRDISSIEENVGADVIARKSPWKPSFDPEDFSNPPSQANLCVLSGLTPCTDKNAVSYGVYENPDMGTHKYVC